MNRNMFSRAGVILALMIAIVAAFPARPLSAQTPAGPKTVTYDTPVEGQVTDAAPQDNWTFVSAGKDRISVTVERTGGTLVPSVQILDTNNQRLAGADYDSTYARSVVRDFELPSAGTYTISVSRYQDKDGKTSGNYKLTVALKAAGEDNPALKPAASPLDYEKPATGEITNGKWKNFWTFSSKGKDWITAVAQRTDGTIQPRMDLLDSSGNKLTGSSVNEAYDGSTISRFQLPGAGKYMLAVYRDSEFDGVTVGKYSLTLHLDGAGPENADLFKPVGPVQLDGSLNGALTNAKWVDVYTLDAKSKDHVILTVTRVDGNLSPTIVLLGANQQKINQANAEQADNVAVLDAELPGPGSYQVLVERYSADGGITSGKYELDAQLAGVGDDNPGLKTSAGEVKIGTPAKGNLTGAKWQDNWTLNLTSKDPVTIIVKRTGGTLVPQCTLFGANNQEITGCSLSETYDQTELKAFEAPGPGQYTLTIYRDGKTDGGTTGAYEIDITQGSAQ